MISYFDSIFAFLFGACAGSFLNVCVGRWPLERSVIKPRSRCPHCGHQLAWFENIPLVSWLALRARCRCCDEPISIQYPLVELAVALGWLAAARAYGFNFTALRVAVIGTTLLGVALTDARHYLIPDGFTLFGFFFTIATAIVAWFWSVPGPFAEPYGVLIGACAGAGALAIVGWLGEVVTRKEAMGMGDITLMAFIGAALGPGRALLTIFLGAMIGAVTFLGVIYPAAWIRRGGSREQTELALGGAPMEIPLVPFGVFLAPAGLVALLWGNAILAWVVRT